VNTALVAPNLVERDFTPATLEEAMLLLSNRAA